jgi:hypothetical protein
VAIRAARVLPPRLAVLPARPQRAERLPDRPPRLPRRPPIAAPRHAALFTRGGETQNRARSLLRRCFS